jgi:uncharacterized protein Yka (UPF0111/DUF47 family)
MIKEEKKIQEVTVKQKYCDDCGVKINRTMACSVAKCEICGKDLCDNCVAHEDKSYDDYRIVFCSKCWTIGEKYRNEIKKLETEIDRLTNEYVEKCRS